MLSSQGFAWPRTTDGFQAVRKKSQNLTFECRLCFLSSWTCSLPLIALKAWSGCVGPSLRALAQHPAPSPAMRGFLFGFFMIPIILVLNVMQSSMPLSLKSLVTGEYRFAIALGYVEWRGKGHLRARWREAPARSGGVGQHTACSASAWPSNHKAVFPPLQQCWQSLEKTLFFFSFFLLISGVTATQLGAGTGVCEQAASPSPHTHTRLGLSLPSPPPHRAPGRLWTARADLGCGSQGSELALAGIARMSDYVCLCLCNVWNFPPPVSIPRTLAGFFGSLGRVVFHTAQRTHSIYPINYIAMLQVKAALCISIWGIWTGKMLCRGACICAGWRHCLECPSALVPGTRVAWWD